MIRKNGLSGMIICLASSIEDGNDCMIWWRIKIISTSNSEYVAFVLFTESFRKTKSGFAVKYSKT